MFDRKAIATNNLASVRLPQGALDDAVLGYRAELTQALDTDPTCADAVFNLAGLTIKAGEIGAAKSLYERFLTLGPPADRAATARKAITYCLALMAG